MKLVVNHIYLQSNPKQAGSQHWDSSTQPAFCPLLMDEDLLHFQHQACSFCLQETENIIFREKE